MPSQPEKAEHQANCENSQLEFSGEEQDGDERVTFLAHLLETGASDEEIAEEIKQLANSTEELRELVLGSVGLALFNKNVDIYERFCSICGEVSDELPDIHK